MSKKKKNALEKKMLNVDFNLSDLRLSNEEIDFVDSMVENNFDFEVAVDKLFEAPDDITIKHIAEEYGDKKHVREALRRLKMIYEAASDWNYKKSVFHAQLCMQICMSIVRDETKADKTRMNWMKRAEFWKENLDKMSGYYKEHVPEREPAPKEIGEFTDAELDELAGLVDDADYKQLPEKSNGET